MIHIFLLVFCFCFCFCWGGGGVLRNRTGVLHGGIASLPSNMADHTKLEIAIFELPLLVRIETYSTQNWSVLSNPGPTLVSSTFWSCDLSENIVSRKQKNRRKKGNSFFFMSETNKQTNKQENVDKGQQVCESVMFFLILILGVCYKSWKHLGQQCLFSTYYSWACSSAVCMRKRMKVRRLGHDQQRK